MMNAVIHWKDVGGIYARSTLLDLPVTAGDMAGLLTLATALHLHSNAGVVGYSMMQWDETAITPALVNSIGLNSDKALITVRFVQGGQTYYKNLWLPNPNVATHFEMIQEEGYRMLTASRLALADLLTTSAGFDVVVTEGRLLTKNANGRRRGKNSNCIEFVDSMENSAYMKIPGSLLGIPPTGLPALATAIDAAAFSNSRVIAAYEFNREDEVVDPANALAIPIVDANAPTPDFSTVETRAIIKCSHMEIPLKQFTELTLPAIKFSELVASKGQWKVLQARGVLIAAAVATFTSYDDVSFVGSKVKGIDIQ
jgi:hypothetical protein